MSSSYRIADFGPSDLLTSGREGARRVKVGLDSRHHDPFRQYQTVTLAIRGATASTDAQTTLRMREEW